MGPDGSRHVLARLLALAILVQYSVQAQPAVPWKLTRSDHFEVYSQAKNETARAALAWFETLRAFFVQQTGLKPERSLPVRVIGFRSPQEYQPYRVGSGAYAYYVGYEGRDYIVMPSLNTSEFGTAAHEYAHSMFHAAGLELPVWLNEGLAELFSTIQVTRSGSSLGGDLPRRSQVLHQRAWISLSELWAVPPESLRTNRDIASLFYAQSWALTDMLVLSPEYGPRFREFIAAILSGMGSSQAFKAVYGKSPDAITRDLGVWASRKQSPRISFPSMAT